MRAIPPLALAAGLLPTAAIGQPAAAPADLNQFGLICFCTSRVATPHGLVAMDNNGLVLNAARKPVTKAELAAAGAPVLDSQLRLLRDWGLMTRHGDRYETNFPVLGPAEMAALRARLLPHAERLAAASENDVTRILAELRRRDRTGSAYPFLFSYVLDGLVWRRLEAMNRLPKLEITVQRPFWAGTFWAVWPKQDDTPGTNETSAGPASLRMMWTPAVLMQYSRLTDDPATAVWLRAAAASAPGGPYPPAAAESPLAEALLIDERRDDPLLASGGNIGHRTAEAIVNMRLDDVIPKASDSQRVLIATHELIWMMLKRLSARHGLRQPEVARTGSASLSDLAPLLIVTVKPDTP